MVQMIGCTCSVLALFSSAQPSDSTETGYRRPVHTYSIVARDPTTGQLGVAVQSHWFSVGSVVTWAEAGVGAVATQSLADPAYGPLGLTMMRSGRTAPDALRGLLASDDGREVRQVAMIDASGRVAVHTGAKCIAQAGHVTDNGGQFSVQANLMEKDGVWPAMAEAYRSTSGDVALEHNDFELANREYTSAGRYAPDIVEFPFWQAVALTSSGQLEQALPVFKSVFAREARWIEVVPRLVPAGLLPDNEAILKRILAQADEGSPDQP